MECTKEAIEKIESMARAADGLDVLIEDRHWTTRDLKPVIFEPRPDPIEISSLTGFVDYIDANRDGIHLESAVAIIRSYKRVDLVSAFGGQKLQRSTYLTASIDDGLKVYPFEKFMEVEGFVIALRSMFEPTEDLERLITYVSKVRGGKSFSLDDDGISQSASVVTGVSGALTKKETAPAIVRLRPYRTFRDIPQVESEFLFRMKLVDTESNTVGCALFEADGGRWRNQAVLSIKEFLQGYVGEVIAIIA